MAAVAVLEMTIRGDDSGEQWEVAAKETRMVSGARTSAGLRLDDVLMCTKMKMSDWTEMRRQYRTWKQEAEEMWRQIRQSHFDRRKLALNAAIPSVKIAMRRGREASVEMVQVEVLAQQAVPSSSSSLSPEWELLWWLAPWLLTPLALAVHLYQAKVAGLLADGVRMLYSSKQHDEKVRKLAADLAAVRAEQRTLSPVNDFAAYFKKDRAANKLQEQYDQAVKERSAAAPRSLLLVPLTTALVHLLPLALLNATGPQPTAVCLPVAAYWPLNGLLRFPSVFSASDESGCDELSTGVSLFVFLYLAVLFVRRALAK